ncbi:YoaK family protein [Pseudobutyrivibrio sp. LB2011]|uniref:YoaK family protein n=1 Tax=Pseudobutyrivibrio sp. LB2011 TaxID=1408312 RepID=UPI0005D27C9D|nr:YoaK family protein [Pseudobutyrivibrio sp. LB2011]
MKSRQTSESFLLSAIVSASGGFQDAYTYNLRDKVFANAQTGNIVLMSQHLMQREWAKGLRYLLPILSFAVGILIAEQVSFHYRNAKKIHWRQIVLLIEIIVLSAVAFLPASLNVLANVLVSLACAMQVQSFRKVNGYPYASTMCIGNLRSGTESLSVYLRNHEKGALKKAMHYYGIIIVFAIGAGIGGILSIYLGYRCILISSVLLLLAFLMMRKEHL